MKFPQLALTLVGLAAGLALTAQRAHAWGEAGHRQIALTAIELTRETPLGKCFAAIPAVLARTSVTPDTDWKLREPLPKDPKLLAATKAADGFEHSLHFFETDAFAKAEADGSLASSYLVTKLTTLPSNEYAAALPILTAQLTANATYVAEINPAKAPKDLARPSPAEVVRFGTAPWRALQFYRIGVEALRGKDLGRAVLALGVLSHYVGDLSQPFHTVLNFDGQHYPGGNAAGIHRALDVDVIESGGQAVGPALLAEARKTMESRDLDGLSQDRIIPELIRLAVSGYPYVAPLLDAFATNRDKFANSVIADMRQGVSRMKVLATAEKRMAEAAVLTARLWAAAYQDAGRPQLPECATISFKKLPLYDPYYKPTYIPGITQQ